VKKYYPYIKNKELIQKIALANKFYDLKVKDITYGNNEAEKYYNEHPEQFITGDIYRIDVKDIETAETVVKAFLKGEKFEDLARKYSVDLSSKDNGGFIGNMPLSQYSAVINYDLTRIKENQITEPINRGEYYEVILIKNISKKSFEEVKDYLTSWLTDTAKQEKIAKTADEILKNAKIKINWDEVYRIKIRDLK
ncbi:MAG: peptidylprolyl isomerase, partial [Arcobacter sp.]